MTVQALQCPKCGAPLPVEPGRDRLFCSQCGAQLTITTSSSGYPMASLADIKADTSVLAAEATLTRVVNELREIRAEADTLAATLNGLLNETQRATRARRHRRLFYGSLTCVFACGAIMYVPMFWSGPDVVSTRDAVPATALCVLPVLVSAILTVVLGFLRSSSHIDALEQQSAAVTDQLRRATATIRQLEQQEAALRRQVGGSPTPAAVARAGSGHFTAPLPDEPNWTMRGQASAPATYRPGMANQRLVRPQLTTGQEKETTRVSDVLLAILCPIVGLILGVVMVLKDHTRQRGIVLVVLSVVFGGLPVVVLATIRF